MVLLWKRAKYTAECKEPGNTGGNTVLTLFKSTARFSPQNYRYFN